MSNRISSSAGTNQRLIACAAAIGAAILPGAAACACSSSKPVPVIQTWTPAGFTIKKAKITIWSGPVDYGHQLQITNGPDKSLWLALSAQNAIMKLSTKGSATIYATPSLNSDPEAIDDNGKAIWFTEFQTGCVGTINKAGLITEYPTGLAMNFSTGMAAGLSRNSWFGTDQNSMYEIGPKGSVTNFPIPDPSAQLTAVALGPDGNMWFEEFSGPNVGYVTPSGTVQEFPVFNGGSSSYGIAAGPDGRIWFTDAASTRIGAIAVTGGKATYYTAGLTGQPASITAGPDGNLYFGEYDGTLGRVTTDGVITEFPLVMTEGSFPVISLTIGPDGDIWFSNNAHSQVGQLKLPIQ